MSANADVRQIGCVRGTARGIGTLEELVEQMTWAQLGQHNKPILLANMAGFWKPLLVLLAHMREYQFIRPSLEIQYLVAESVPDISRCWSRPPG